MLRWGMLSKRVDVLRALTSAHRNGGGGGGGGGARHTSNKATTDEQKANQFDVNINKTPDSNRSILYDANRNKGLAFTEEERVRYHLKGYLPAGYHNQAHQVMLSMEQVRQYGDNLHKYMYLRNIQNNNKQLFYMLLRLHPDELLPIIYTPVVGVACQRYSRLFDRPRGMYITINDAGSVEQLFRNYNQADVRAIVVTDGERVLGLGDLGCNGMAIPIGKMALYTAIGGVRPQVTMPICLDVGTNNDELLVDPYYIGLHQRRVPVDEYDRLLDEFMQTVTKFYGRNCLVQFEDFANHNAKRLLDKYRQEYCVFNDDIQGTASVVLSGIITSLRKTRVPIDENNFLFVGAGSAALGIADFVVRYMVQNGMTEEAAIEHIWMMDQYGLVTQARDKENADRMRYAKNVESIENLEDVVKLVKPTCLIGASGCGGIFTASILRFLGEINRRPIVFALSNPTDHSECTAQQAYEHTGGRCIFASGSPFDKCTYQGQEFETSQSNNVYIFPAIALATIACKVATIENEAFIEAAKALSNEISKDELALGRLYPRLDRIRHTSLKVAAHVAEWYYRNQFAQHTPEPKNKFNYLKSIQYIPSYDQSLPK